MVPPGLIVAWRGVNCGTFARICYIAPGASDYRFGSKPKTVSEYSDLRS